MYLSHDLILYDMYLDTYSMCFYYNFTHSDVFVKNVFLANLKIYFFPNKRKGP